MGINIKKFFRLTEILPWEIAWAFAKRQPSVEELQEQYAFSYYSTMNKAVTDVNNGTAGVNADATKDTAAAGVYIDENGGQNIVLLKDYTEAERLKPSKDMTINLGGHTLSSANIVCINVDSGNLTVDGRLPGSGILARHGATAARCIQIYGSGLTTVKGGLYVCETNGSGSSGCVPISVQSTTASLDISDSIISATDNTEGAKVNGLMLYGAATISNCKVTATAKHGKVVGVYGKSRTNIVNCDISGYSNYTQYGSTYTERAIGIENAGGILKISNSYVLGNYSGLSNHGTLYVNGGTFEGYGHGGIYFSEAETTAYVRNANLKDMPIMPDGYEENAGHNGAAFYIGGSTGADNISIYMDNCDCYSPERQIVLRGSSGEQYNSLYISNSRCHDTSGKGIIRIRIDNDTHKLYLGRGNNFTSKNTTLPEAVIVTDEVYAQEVA